MLGLYYSAKRTRALDDDNRIKLDVSRQNNFLEAVKLLKDESPFVIAGAIESLNKNWNGARRTVFFGHPSFTGRVHKGYIPKPSRLQC